MSVNIILYYPQDFCVRKPTSICLKLKSVLNFSSFNSVKLINSLILNFLYSLVYFVGHFIKIHAIFQYWKAMSDLVEKKYPDDQNSCTVGLRIWGGITTIIFIVGLESRLSNQSIKDNSSAKRRITWNKVYTKSVGQHLTVGQSLLCKARFISCSGLFKSYWYWITQVNYNITMWGYSSLFAFLPPDVKPVPWRSSLPSYVQFEITSSIFLVGGRGGSPFLQL